MRRLAAAGCLALALAAAPAHGDAIDHYTLILSWTPGLCWDQPERKECAGLSLRRYDGRNLALLALRPDPPAGNMRDDYCFAGMGDQEFDRSKRWCDMDEVHIRSADLRATLAEVMPVTQSCQERGVWARYGTCSLYSPNDYFSRGVKLAKSMAATLLNVRIVGAAGQSIKQSELISSFEMQYGDNSAKALHLVCKTRSGKAHLMEVQVAVTPHALTKGLDRQELFKPDTPLRGKCPSEIFIDGPKDLVQEPAAATDTDQPAPAAVPPGQPVPPDAGPVVPAPKVAVPEVDSPKIPGPTVDKPAVDTPVVPKITIPAPGD